MVAVITLHVKRTMKAWHCIGKTNEMKAYIDSQKHGYTVETATSYHITSIATCLSGRSGRSEGLHRLGHLSVVVVYIYIPANVVEVNRPWRRTGLKCDTPTGY